MKCANALAPISVLISATGSMADVFPHRFSTKYYDAETDLYYYGYRYYSPSLGRWISRDPIEEEGGVNLYAMCGNAPLCEFDRFGLKIHSTFKTNRSGGWLLTLYIPIQVVDCAPRETRLSDFEIQESLDGIWSRAASVEKTVSVQTAPNVFADIPISVEISLQVNTSVKTVHPHSLDPNQHVFILECKHNRSEAVPRDVSHAQVGGFKAWIYLDSRTNPGTFAHEFGHWLGLSDLYDTTVTDDDQGNAVSKTTSFEGYERNIMADSSERGVAAWQLTHIRKFVQKGIRSEGPPVR